MNIPSSHWLLNEPIAHRGLHSQSAPENTLPAFAQAIKKGHPIELDIQIIKDGTIVVFHDNDLMRVCNQSLRLDQITKNDLTKFKVLEKETIPTLSEVLDFIKDQVPILIEIKNEKSKNSLLHDNTLKVLKNYNGRYAIQSFNPLTVRYFLKNLPQIPTGILSCDFSETKLSFIKKFYLKNIIDAFLVQPNFISYDYKTVLNLNKLILKRLKDIPIITWTITDKKQFEGVKGIASNYIFDKI